MTKDAVTAYALDSIRRYEKLKLKDITRYTRAGKWGKGIQCPHCKEVSWVYHFSWCGLTCQGCDQMVDKYDWKVASP